MKKLLIAITLAFLPFLYANAQTIKNESHERVLTHVEANVYEVSFLNADGKIVQKGQYWKEGELYKPHGTWVLFAENSNTVITKSKFDKGAQLWVETKMNGKTVRADQKEMTIAKLETKIAKLERQISQLKNNK